MKSDQKTVLVVDDMEEMTHLVSAFVRTLGHHVLAACHPMEALRLSQAHPGEIDLLVTDVEMPLMNGLQLADSLRSLRPNIKTVYMSANPEHLHSFERSTILFLAKPFSIDELGRTISEAFSK